MTLLSLIEYRHTISMSACLFFILIWTFKLECSDLG